MLSCKTLNVNDSTRPSFFQRYKKNFQKKHQLLLCHFRWWHVINNASLHVYTAATLATLVCSDAFDGVYTL